MIFSKLSRVFLIVPAVMAFLAAGKAVYPVSAADGPETDFSPSYQFRETYEDYLAQYRGAVRPDKNLVIPAAGYSATDMDIKVDKSAGRDGSIVLTGEKGFIEWEVDVAEAGLYNMAITYRPIPGKATSIEREIKINGQDLFAGANTLVFHRIWGDAGPFLTDTAGNEIRPRQEEKPIWQTATLSDSSGYIQEPYLFYFQAGRNTIRLISRAEPMAIAKIELFQAVTPKTYRALARAYKDRGYKAADNVFLKIQGEKAVRRSSPSLFPVFDQGDPTMEPYNPAEARLNSIGGYRWQLVGDWIEWEFEVPKDGLYQIAVKAKQDSQRGIYSNRTIEIDGRVPCAELRAVRFNYTDRYRMKSLGQDEEGRPYLFYLAKGRHFLRMKVTLGNLADLLRRTEATLYELNTAYRNIIMITSATPDPLRSYQLEERIPDLLGRLKKQAKIISGMADDFEHLTAQKGGHTAVLRDIARLLLRMVDKPWIIPSVLAEYRDGVGNLGTWIVNTRNQPLQIDYIVVASPEKKLPRATPTFAQTLKHEISAFFASFSHDYTSLRATKDGGAESVGGSEAIKIWIGMGRDQAQVLKQMIDDTFTPETNIPVKLQLIDNMGALLVPATVANRAPDVALGAANMDLAFRGAVADLRRFPDFDVVAKRFKKSALVPFRFREAVYALPETQSFPMLFYRKDVLAELGLQVPQTWDDVYRLLPMLQKKHLEFGLSPDMGTFAMFLYQKGVSLYKEDCIETNLESEAAIATFEEMTDLYALYGLPLTYNFINRFRMGEMPLAIANYSDFNTLSVFAPELRGQWGLAPVPGVREPDGAINRTVPVSQSVLAGTTIPTGTTGSMIMSKSTKKKQAWEFLKWWTSTDTQVRFGREMESLMGAAARWPTANTEALQQLPRKAEDREVLNEQWNWVEGIPPVLGGYYVTRQFDWLFRAVVLENEPLRESVVEYGLEANKEIARKRREFGYETSYPKLDRKWKTLFWDQYTHVYRLDVRK